MLEKLSEIFTQMEKKYINFSDDEKIKYMCLALPEKYLSQNFFFEKKRHISNSLQKNKN